MNKHLVFLFSALVAVQAQDAQQQLSDLRALVLGHILAAQDDLDNLYSDMESFSNTLIKDGDLTIYEVYLDVAGQLHYIKDQAKGKDISRCTSGREQMIHKLPKELTERLETCVVKQIEEAATVLDSSAYLIDVVMSRVHNLEFQLGLCAEDATCVEAIRGEIEDDTVKLPMQIEVQLEQATEMVDELKVIVQECHDKNVADFTGYVTDLLSQIADCINKILG